MPIPGLSFSASYSSSKTNADSHNVTRSNQDSHDLTTSEANRYDQHYHNSNSGNETITDESNRSTTTTTTMIDKSYHVNIINSSFHQPGLSGNNDSTLQPIGAPYHTAVIPSLPIYPCSRFESDGDEKEDNKIELDLEILLSKMSSEMEECATNSIILAFVKRSDEMTRAKYICDSFEKQFGKSFHCVVGNEFGNFVNYLKKSYIHVKVADQRVIIFKTPDITADSETEIMKLQDSLEETKISLEAMETCNALIEEYRDGMDINCAVTKPVDFVNKKHEELQNIAIQKFEEWTKKNEITLAQKHRQEFIALQTNKFFSMYYSRNKERYEFENKSDETQWIAASNGDFPDGAIIGCKEFNGTTIIARAWHDKSLIPGKLFSKDQVCYVCYDGYEYKKYTYEVLCHAKVSWVRVFRDGCIPPKALAAGHETNGETLYIGRAQHAGTLILGKVVPSHFQCHIPYYGYEYSYHEYEILVQD